MKNKCAEAAEWYSIFVPISAMRGLLADTQTEQRKALATMFLYGLKKSFESNEFSKEEEHSTWLYYQKKYSWIQKEWQFVDMSKYNRYECFLIMRFDMFEEILCLIKEHTKKSYFELMVIVAYLSYYSMLGCKNTMKCSENLILGRMCGFSTLPKCLFHIPKAIKKIVRKKNYLLPKIRKRICEKYPDMVFYGGNKFCKMRGYYVCTSDSGFVYNNIVQLPALMNDPAVSEEQKRDYCTKLKNLCIEHTERNREYQEEKAILKELDL